MILFIASISHASGDTEKRLTVLLISGTAAAHDRELVASTAETIAREAGLSLANESFTTKEIAVIRRCATTSRAWNCILPIIRNKGIQQVMMLTLANDTSTNVDPTTILTGQMIAAHLDAAVTDQRFCVHCTDNVLVDTTSELTHSLFLESEIQGGRTVVSIRSSPRGARIIFDGHPIGSTDRAFNTSQGKHTVVLELDGYHRESQTIEATLGKASELSITMQPGILVEERHNTEHRKDDLSPSPSSNSSPKSSLAPKLTMGVGALAIVAGVIALVFDQDPSISPRGIEQPRYYYDTTRAGTGLIIGGVVVGMSGYLWWHYTNSTVVPTIAPVPGGASVGMMKLF